MKTLKFDNADMRLYMASMGKLFRVTAVCHTTEQANGIMARDRSQVVIAEDCNGLIYLAEQYGAKCPSTLLDDKPFAEAQA